MPKPYDEPVQPAGHLHVPVVQFDPANATAITDPTYESNRDNVVTGAHAIPATPSDSELCGKLAIGISRLRGLPHRGDTPAGPERFSAV